MKLLQTIAFCLFGSALLAQSTVHSENFSGTIGTWTAVDVADPANAWTSTSGYMEMYGSGGSNDEDWLISPALNMDAQSNEYFMFDYNDAFDGTMIELYYSVNYNGGGTTSDVQSATWTPLALSVFDINTTACFSNLFQRHPAIDVAGINGTSVHFAFKYTGTAATAKRYRIDNVHIEADYYGSIEAQIALGLGCGPLKTEIYNTVKTQSTVVNYTSSSYDIWDAILQMDRRLNDAGTATIVWDMFTDIPTGTGEFEFDHCSDRDQGSCPGGEGQCYNREHTLPRSWWGGGTAHPADTQNFDLHHVTPSDRSMNSAKLNYPPGEVTSPSTTGSNGFKIGFNTSYPCPSMLYFEPIDEFKGDYARIFFFLATRYETQIGSWASLSTQADCALDGSSHPVFEPWLIDLLLTWSANDTVSQKEIDRNNAIYGIQGNRNPFIDNPEWIGYIWGDTLGNSCGDLLPVPCSSTSSSESIASCESSYTWSADGAVYSTSGIYTATLVNAAGCDSIATLNLTFNSVDPSVSQNGNLLTANLPGAVYQWVDCDDNFSELVGETNVNFVPSANGNYAAIVTDNGCSDTSSCFVISTIGLNDILPNEDFRVFPNPTSGHISIDLPSRTDEVTVRIIDAIGQVVNNEVFQPSESLDLSITSGNGMYIIEIDTIGDETLTASFVKN